ncbi:MAG: N-6 DNA methylase, partial [Ruminococcus sp.]|nr:N-6 DNA methylase [Ruminococcus sp.]
SYLLGENYTFIINNALSYKYPCAYDKIFSNYPFAIKGSDMDVCRKELAEYFDLDPVSIARCSSDWLFNSTVIRNLKETGKAVVIMTNGAAFNKPDSILRKIFVERGYIEAVINLPPRLFTEFSIPVTMLVLSHNNSSIKMINAENIYSRGERKNLTLSDDNLNTIYGSLNNGGDNTIVVTLEDMAEHEYSLMASHYLEKPVIDNGVEFRSIIKSITRGAQIKPDALESYRSDTPTDLRYISLSNVNYGTIIIEDDQQYITELPKQLEKFVVPKNALVLSKMASPTFRSAIVSSDNDQTIVATGNLYIIEIDESKANPYFIQAFFDSRIGEAALNYVSGGTVVKNISTEGVKSVVIPLPPIEEQNAIAQKYQAALDEYDILKKKLQRVLERKRTLINGEG